MMKNNKKYKITDPTYQELMEMLIEKTKTTSERLNVSEVSREWKERSGLTDKDLTIDRRLRNFRLKINRIEKIDIETRVRLLFALSVPVEQDVFRKMKNMGSVTLDSYRRIVEFKGRNLELSAFKKKMPKKQNSEAIRPRSPQIPQKIEEEEDPFMEGSSQNGYETVLDDHPMNFHDSFLEEIDLDSDESEYIGGYAEAWNDQLFEIDEGHKENIWKREEDNVIVDVETIEETRTPILAILEALRQLILELKLESLSEVLKMIEGRMEADIEKKTSIEGFQIALKMSWCIVVLNSPISTTEPFISVKEYLQTLHRCLTPIKIPEIEDFRRKLRETIQEEDKEVSVANIRDALEMILYIIDE